MDKLADEIRRLRDRGILKSDLILLIEKIYAENDNQDSRSPTWLPWRKTCNSDQDQ